jgi:hypothetical protein
MIKLTIEIYDDGNLTKINPSKEEFNASKSELMLTTILLEYVGECMAGLKHTESRVN